MPIVPKASYVEWIPGNGTRYALHFTYFPNGAFGRTEPTIMIAGTTYAVSKAMLLGTEWVTSISLDMVRRRMNLNESDGIPVTIMIAAVLGIEVEIPDDAKTEFTPWRALPPFTFQEESGA